MNKKITTFLIAGVIILIMGVIVAGSKNKNQPVQSETAFLPASPVLENIAADVPVFFYGNTCPHCADVEAWMKENNLEDKIKIVKKEVYEDRLNALELERAAKNCGLNTNSIGVPFLYTEGKCLIGTPDIINYFTEKTK